MLGIKKMKKIFSWLLLVFLLTVVSSYWWAIKGSWLDEEVSFLTSKKFHVKAHFKNIRILHWSQIHFDSFMITAIQGEQCLNGGEGELNVSPLSFLSKFPRVFNVQLKHVIISPALYKPWLPIAFSVPKWLEALSVINEVHVRIEEGPSRINIRILKARSSSAGLQGGIRVEGKRITKMHLIVRVSKEISRRLPGLLRSRLLLVSNGWEAARIIYCKNVLTAIGQTGPFFRFQWQNDR